MKPRFWPVLIATLLGGCVEHAYEIELTPTDKSLERMLTVRRHSSKKSLAEVEAEIARLAKEYGDSHPVPNDKQVYQGNFMGRMPNDIGGHGTFTRWDTPLGSAAVYVERFRGAIDIAEELKRREAAANRLTDLLVDWLGRQLNDDPHWPQLRKFLNDNFRRDLINLSIYAWTIDLSEQTKDAEIEDRFQPPHILAVHYLVERGYFTPDEVPSLLRIAHDLQREDHQRWTVWLKRLMAGRVEGAPDSWPALDVLESPERLMESLREFLETTEEYTELTKQWQAEQKTNRNAVKPDALQVGGNLLERLFGQGILSGHDEISVTLNTAHPPIFTNGEWNADEGQIQWKKEPLPRAERSPALMYAVWDEPNEPAQQRYFGKTVFEGESLLEYCLWYHGLTDNERKEWDAFLDQRRPGPDLAAELKGFRFSHEPAGIKEDDRLAKEVVEAILEGLKP